MISITQTVDVIIDLCINIFYDLKTAFVYASNCVTTNLLVYIIHLSIELFIQLDTHTTNFIVDIVI